jgi:ABC-type sugar transport system ATPase subunit
MPFDVTIPRLNNSPLSLRLNVGDTLFVLGANGTGKSALMSLLYQAHAHTARRVSAHRQTWFQSSSPSLTSADRRAVEQNILNWDQQPTARWMEISPDSRANVAIYDLINGQNLRARDIANAVDAGDFDLAKSLSKNDAPITVVNELFRLSAIPITLSVR